MKFALLISTYNWSKALDLVLKSLSEQSVLPDEVLIADDGSDEDTQKVITSYQEKIAIPIRHFWQEDKGFRKARILNKAIAACNSEYIIQVDGDCIMGKHFVRDHKHFAAKGFFLYGSRVNIQQNFLPTLFEHKYTRFYFFSFGIKKRSRALRIPIFSNMFKAHGELSSKLRGCNFSFHREDFIAVNGFNEDFEGWGKEDSEFAARLLNYGCKGKRLRYRAVVFHIWHQEKSRNRLAINEELQQAIQTQKMIRCKNGVDQYLS